jgi:hypothetical protein
MAPETCRRTLAELRLNMSHASIALQVFGRIPFRRPAAFHPGATATNFPFTTSFTRFVCRRPLGKLFLADLRVSSVQVSSTGPWL